MKSDQPISNRYEDQVAHRMLDANLNRAFEGLRTLEDIARFQNLGILQHALKMLRHRLQSATDSWDFTKLLIARNAYDDVGREVKAPSETDRAGGLADIGSAASQRLQQSLRCLEEVAKMMYPTTALEIEAVRYESYDVSAKVMLTHQRDRAFLERARLYVLADCQLPMPLFEKRIREVSHGGAGLIQIRDKQVDARELIRYTNAAIQAVEPSATRIVINDRADIVQCTEAWGIHVGQTDLTVAQARSLIRPSCVIGLSTHDLTQVRDAIERQADYIGCGPTFVSSTKGFQSFAGLDFLRRVSETLGDSEGQIPAFAIGGIDLTNLDSLMDTGFRRVAVSSAVWRADKPGVAVEAFYSRLIRAS